MFLLSFENMNVFHKAFHTPRTAAWMSKVMPYLKRGERILDVGSGGGNIAKALIDRGFQVTTMDIVDKSYFKETKPVLYDGTTFPFSDDSFDVAMCVTMLHHTPDPIHILREAMRVAPRLVVVEDLHANTPQKWLTYAMDSVLNREFIAHPHSNRDRAGWEKAFSELGLRILDFKQENFWFFFTSGTWYLELLTG